MNNYQAPDKDSIYKKLHSEGKTLKEWVYEKGYSYQTAIRVVNGLSKATRGESLAIAIDLGIKTIKEK